MFTEKLNLKEENSFIAYTEAIPLKIVYSHTAGQICHYWKTRSSKPELTTSIFKTVGLSFGLSFQVTNGPCTVTAFRMSDI